MQTDMQSETAGTGNQQVQSAAADTRGKHRVLADLKRIEQESRFLEVSSICSLVILTIKLKALS